MNTRTSPRRRATAVVLVAVAAVALMLALAALAVTGKLPHLGSTTQDPAAPASQSPERAALMALYKATNGPHWQHNSGWETSDDICGWYGVACANKHVTRLDLSYTRLTGPIPPELGNLTNLRWLYLAGNRLTGPIPDALSKLTNLWELHLDHNRLTGIPPELGNLTNLTKLDLSNNELTGIPPELGNLTNLTELHLAGNGCLTANPSLTAWLNKHDSGWNDGCT
jgi:hypothetical protein